MFDLWSCINELVSKVCMYKKKVKAAIVILSAIGCFVINMSIQNHNLKQFLYTFIICITVLTFSELNALGKFYVYVYVYKL